MLNPNGSQIYSAGLIELANLIYSIVVEKAPLGKPVLKDWDKVYKALPLIDALADINYLEDSEANALYSCLSQILELNNVSTYPTLAPVEPIVINQGPPGPKGDKGDPGTDGVDGTDGVGIQFLGTFGSPPSSPTLNQAYRNSVTGRTEIWDGSVWQLMNQDGLSGTNGADGLDGEDGIDGTDGNTILAGTTNPSNGLGVNGDFYINTITWQIFGPKQSGVWGTGTDIIGADGTDGTDGIDGVDGATGPAGTNGTDGTSSYIYLAFSDSSTGSGYILVQSNDDTATLSPHDATKAWFAVLSSSSKIGATINQASFDNKWTRIAGDGDRWRTFSNTSLTIGTGLRTLTVEQSLAYSVGQSVVIADPSDFNNRMEGYVVSYVPSTGILVVSVINDFGTGTLTNWDVNLQAFAEDPPITYNGDSPSTVAVNDMPAGTTLTGLTFEYLLERVFAPFVDPTFSSFVMSGQATELEVGDSVSGSKTFTWGTTNSSNVATNSIDIIDQTGGPTNLVSNTANDGTESGVAVGTVTKTSPASHIWRISGDKVSPGVGSFTRDFTVSWLWRKYHGTSSNTILTESQIEALTTSSLSSTEVGTYTFSASNYKYFAWPDSFGSPTAGSGFRDASTNLNISMADSTDHASYSNVENGWSYALISVTNSFGQTTNYRLYRTKFTLGAAMTIIVS